MNTPVVFALSLTALVLLPMATYYLDRRAPRFEVVQRDDLVYVVLDNNNDRKEVALFNEFTGAATCANALNEAEERGAL